MNIYQSLNTHILESSRVKLKTLEKMGETCEKIINLISDALANGNKVLIFGNGGSAADSQHIAAEFMSVLEKKTNSRKALSALSLASDVAFLTAHSNDFHFDYIFSRQISGLAQKGDVLIGISTSGNSKNVNNGMMLGKELDLHRICFTGLNGKNIINNSDHSLIIQSSNTQIIQENYMCFSHIIIAEIEKRLGL
jgi:D-sedoheptulose 7-phosphate isomerase